MKPNVIKKRKNKKTKTTLVFDEAARADYLTGFRKRKLERKKRGQEQLERQLKEERRRIKEQHRNEILKYKELAKNCLSEMEDIATPSTIDLPEHTVTIVDVADIDLGRSNGTRLGFNDGELEVETEKSEKNVNENAKNTSGNKSSLKKQLQLKPSKYQKHKNKSHLMDKHKLAAKAKRSKKKQITKAKYKGR